MKKITLNENISALKKVSSRIPKTINEAINFEGPDDDMNMPGAEDDMSNAIDNPGMPQNDVPEVKGEEEINVEEFITTMRKNSLKIMAKLSDNPDDAVYQFAKKIFQLADKAHEDEKQGNGIDGQPKQNGNQVPQQKTSF